MNLFVSFVRSASLAVLLLAVEEGRAQTAPPASLTLTRALERAAENHPSLAALRHGERAAEARVEQAGLGLNPTLDVAVENFLGTGEVRGTRSLEATVQASQVIERGGKRGRRVALAGRERETAAREFEVRRLEVLGATALAYAEALAAQQRVTLAEESLRLGRDILATVDSRVKAGEASPAETARARATFVSAQSEHARARAALASARAALAAAYGGESADAGTLSGGIRVTEALPDEVALRAGLGRHPRLGLQEAVVDGQRSELELEQARGVQDVTVGGGVRFLRNGSDATFVAGVSVPLPVRDRNQGNVRAARETLAAAEQERRALENELRAAFAAAWQEVKAAQDAAQTLRREALPATEEAHAIVRRAYEEGQLPLIDVLDAQRALVAVRREILEVEAAFALALVRLEALSNPTFTLTNALFSSP